MNPHAPKGTSASGWHVCLFHHPDKGAWRPSSQAEAAHRPEAGACGINTRHGAPTPIRTEGLLITSQLLWAG